MGDAESDDSDIGHVDLLLDSAYSSVGAFNHGKMEIIPNDFGNNRTTHLVLTENERLIGEAGASPSTAAYDANRLIGDCLKDPLTQEDIQNILDLFFDGEELNNDSISSNGEVPSIVAAVQPADKPETVDDLVMYDVVSLSLGIETESPTDQAAGIMKSLINRNTPIPTKTSNYWFCNSFDNQTCVRISVYEGEHSLVKYNKKLGQFILNDLPPGPRGTVKYYVTFEIKAGGVLIVSAKVKSLGVERSLIISKNIKTRRLTKEEIDQIVAEGERFHLDGLNHRKRALAKSGNNREKTDTVPRQLLKNPEGKKRAKK